MTALRIFLRALLHPFKYRLCSFELEDGSLIWSCLTDETWRTFTAHREDDRV